MGIARDVTAAARLVRNALQQRKARAELREILGRAEPLPAGRFRIAVYFADGEVNLYQLRQWYKPLAELAKLWPVVIMSRAATGAAALLRESPVPVAYVKTILDVEEFLDRQDIRIVLYVNQNARNFQMMRYGRRWHVFINHGESDKMYMTTNQFKAYDYALVAGDAALNRLSRVLWDYDLDKRAIKIGRPQADHYSGTLPYTPDERTVVLYAPTWEGDRPAAAYGSVVTHGVALAEALLADRRYRLIYRPHPRSGVVDHAYGEANRRIIHAIAAANRADPSAHHVYDHGAELGWQLSAADVAIVDVSAMVYDRLAAGKPLLVTRPVHPDAELDEGGYLSDAEWLEASDAPAITRRLEELSHDEQAAVRLAKWVEHYFGDTTPGATTRRFHQAIARLMDEWEEWNARTAASSSTPSAG
ncbi:CDP-glycerol glycerophosphotransferase family protein [Gryllotalpicola ginsengisoli]|uniref:CDP-glycerol glycerophosphotransferase family protein n=1 Tax=Gryllotalpicola ginsengisoli TaxID=444608 RepID=UPI0004847CF0|nr:CDP-glycerol glycerophosphotransferase family protein [Gryllotalpicola ginsengisoli]